MNSTSFTYNYSQPEEYHFSLDSVELAKFVADHLHVVGGRPTPARVLDLCAGCGVIGFDLSFYRRDIRHIDFLEVQSIYQPHFQENVARVGRPELAARFLNLNYRELIKPEWREQYDLIVSNPPYFLPEQGKHSPSEFKNRCRFFLDASFSELLLAMANCLRVGGQAYVLVRDLGDHGVSLMSQFSSVLGSGVSVKKVSQIRGTDVFLMEKTDTAKI